MVEVGFGSVCPSGKTLRDWPCRKRRNGQCSRCSQPGGTGLGHGPGRGLVRWDRQTTSEGPIRGSRRSRRTLHAHPLSYYAPNGQRRHSPNPGPWEELGAWPLMTEIPASWAAKLGRTKAGNTNPKMVRKYLVIFGARHRLCYVVGQAERVPRR
jgi:hypothetical protein